MFYLYITVPSGTVWYFTIKGTDGALVNSANKARKFTTEKQAINYLKVMSTIQHDEQMKNFVSQFKVGTYAN